MSRIMLEKNKQKNFINNVKAKSGLGWDEVAGVCCVCERTVRDWRREKYNMSYEALLKLHETFDIKIPRIKKILPEYWSAKKASRLGGIRRNELYGNLGTPEGRRKGGLAAMMRLRNDPELDRATGLKLRKRIKMPSDSPELAEFIGIMLGDGGISNYQINITFNSKTDREYCVYAQKLIKKLFLVPLTVMPRVKYNIIRVVASAKNLIEFLEKKGLKIGNKVKNSVKIPQWILDNRNYSISCLRGLIDTDGSFYLYRHKVYAKMYCNFAMCFTNHSRPLLEDANKILEYLGFAPVMNAKRIYLHKKDDIVKYFKEVGTHNPKHLRKYKNYVAAVNS